MLASLFSASRASAAPSSDAIAAYSAILNLKYFKLSLYQQGVPFATIPVQRRAYYNVAIGQIQQHITVLQNLIGPSAPLPPNSFNFNGNTGGSGTPFNPFPGSSIALADFYLLSALAENLSVRALKGQIPLRFNDSDALPIIVGMHTADALRAGIFRVFTSKNVMIALVNGDIPQPTTDTSTKTYFSALVYGPAESSRDHRQSRGEDNQIQYNNTIVEDDALFDEPTDISTVTQFLGFFAASAG